MMKLFRIREYKVFLYRLFLAYFFYFIARTLFYLYNKDLLAVDSVSDFLSICYYGLSFDTPAILYVNALFLLCSILPLFINTTKKFQKIVFWIYFIPNLIAYATNFVDLIYYRFTFSRASLASLESISGESNKLLLLLSFVKDYWHVFLLFFACSYLWIKLYKRVELIHIPPKNKKGYVFSSILMLLVFATLTVGGIRGDFKHSTRPLNLVDAGRHVNVAEQANMVLNTPFSIIRTINKNNFKKRNEVSEAFIEQAFHPIKQYNRKVDKKPNVVVIIIESFGREYLGSFNKNIKEENYIGYTPFLDSLANHSMIFPNGFANGRKSIHGMSSVLAGIPSFKTAYTSSSYANQKVESLVSILNSMGYDTSFFHGAPNGSMGFLGFGNILGFDHYYGKNEYKNDDDFDGVWGVWDEPFLEYMNDELSKKKEPFMGTVFTVTSHAPFNIPEKYEGKFPEGDLDMHKCVGYTDYALKKFFTEASKQPWFNNTIFAITADHSNQTFYKEYKKTVNRFSVPIMFYDPNGKFIGEDHSFAQQMDIPATILDIVGYNKPFRSWGRSLVGDSIQKPFAVTHSGNNLLYLQDEYITLLSNQDKVIGLYDINDKGLTKNLLSSKKEKSNEMGKIAKAFVQDYMNRIVDGRLSAESDLNNN